MGNNVNTQPSIEIGRGAVLNCLEMCTRDKDLAKRIQVGSNGKFPGEVGAVKTTYNAYTKTNTGKAVWVRCELNNTNKKLKQLARITNRDKIKYFADKLREQINKAKSGQAEIGR